MYSCDGGISFTTAYSVPSKNNQIKLNLLNNKNMQCCNFLTEKMIESFRVPLTLD